jgi:hypothetical protein
MIRGHTRASWHVRNGTSLREPIALGGWPSFDIVLRYAYLASGHLGTAAQRVDGTNPAQQQLTGLK